MASHAAHTWQRTGSAGILSLGLSPGNYLPEPGFIPLRQAESYFMEPGLKGVIIRGSGRHFSAGADLEKLTALAADEHMLFDKIEQGKILLQMIRNLDVPVIAEIRGACFGGGLEIALACHIRICSDNALFAFPEVNHGIIPGLGGMAALTRLVGPGKAAALILSGDIADAGEALRSGLVDHTAPQKELHEFTLSFLKKLTDDRHPDVVRAVMQSVRNACSMPLEEALAMETRLFCALAVKNLGKA